MPKETERLKLPLPLGNENVTRESINGIFEKIDAGVATRESILISAESDLNSYITEGEYYCPTNATVETLANSPVGVAFHLTIERHAGVVQTLTTFEPSNLQVFQRNYYVGWGPWKKVPTRDDIEEVKVYTDQKLGEIVINDASLTDKGIVQLSNAVDGTREDLAATEKAVRDARAAAETSAKNYTDTGFIKKASIINASSNLNSYTNEGEYYCPANSTVATLLNCPTANAFHLKVERHAGVVQTLTTYVTNNLEVFQRNFYTTWGVWQKVPTRMELDEIKKSGVDAKKGIVDAINAKGGIASTSDLWTSLESQIKNFNIGKRYVTGLTTSIPPYGSFRINTGFVPGIMLFYLEMSHHNLDIFFYDAYKNVYQGLHTNYGALYISIGTISPDNTGVTIQADYYVSGTSYSSPVRYHIWEK